MWLSHITMQGHFEIFNNCPRQHMTNLQYWKSKKFTRIIKFIYIVLFKTYTLGECGLITASWYFNIETKIIHGCKEVITKNKSKTKLQLSCTVLYELLYIISSAFYHILQIKQLQKKKTFEMLKYQYWFTNKYQIHRWIHLCH